MEVSCGVCGKTWDMRDPGVRHIRAAFWACAEEDSCAARAVIRVREEQ